MALAVFVVPLLASVIAAVLVSRRLPVARSWPQLAVWWIVLGAIATTVMVAVDRLLVRLIPIAALHQLAAVFPDRGVGRRTAARVTDRGMDELPEPPLPAQEDLLASVRAMLVRLERHDPKLTGHAHRVRHYAELIAEELELVAEDRERLAWAALLHDIGKLTVPERTLQRVGELAPDERAAIEQHATQSRALAAPFDPWLGEWALAISQHHERWDGGGYPQGLAATQISLGARILAVADAFDALTAPRSYQPTVSTQAGRQVISDGAGTAFDPEVVRAFLNVSIRRLRVVSGGLGLGLQSRATGLVDTATRLATTGTAIVVTGAALAVGGTLELPRLAGSESTPVAVETIEPSPDATPSPTLPSPTPVATPEPSPVPEETPAPVAPVAPVVPVVPVGPVAPPPASPPATPSSVLSSTWTSSVPVGSTLRPGETVTIAVTITNAGPDLAEGAVLTPAVPDGLRGVPGSITVDGGAGPATGFTTGVPLPTLPVGGSTTVTYTLEVPPDATSGLVSPPFVTVTGPAGTSTFNSPGGFAIDADAAVTWTLDATPGDGSMVVPGGRVGVTVTVTNDATAGSTASGLAVAAAVPSGMTTDPTAVSVDGSARTPSALASGIALPDLSPGTTAVVTFDLLVDSPQPDGTVLATVVSLTGPAVGTESAALTHVVDSAGAVTLAASSTPPPGPVLPGTAVTHTYVVTNDAAATATVGGLVLTAPTPTGATYVPGSTRLDGAVVPDASNPLAVGLSLPPLPPGASTTVSFQVTIDLPLPDGTVIAGTASVTGGPAPLGATTTHTASSSPDLSLTLTSSVPPTASLVPGTTVTWSLTFANAATATASATGVTLGLPTPADTTFVPGSAVDGTGTPLAATSNPFTTPVAVPDLAPGDTATITIDSLVDVPLPAGTIVTATGTGDSAQTAPLAAASSLTVTSTSDVSVTLVAAPPSGGTVVPGDVVAFTLSVTNSPFATATATGLALADVTSTGMNDVPGSAFLDGGAIAIPPIGSDLALPSLTPGSTTVVTWQEKVTRPLPDGSLVTLDTKVIGDTLPSPLLTSTSHTVASAPVLDLTIVADRPVTAPVTPGETVSYTATVTNDAAATATATGVVLRLPTPANTAFVAGSAIRPDGTVDVSPTNPFMTPFAVPDLPPGASASVSIDVTVDVPLPNGSPLVANATTDAAEVAAPITRSVTHSISSAPIIGLAVDADPLPSSTVLAGTPITYTVTVSNDPTATEKAVGLVVTVPVPQNTTFTSAVDETGTAVLVGPNPFETAYALSDLAPGASHTLELTVTIDTPLPNGTPIQQFTSLDAIRLATPLAAVTDHEALSDPLLSVSIEAIPDESTPVAPGTVVTYAVTVANAPTATANATGITLVASDPDVASYVPDSGVDELGAPMTGTSTNPFAAGYALADLPPGAFHTVLFDAVIDAPLPDGTTMRQTSEVTADQFVLPLRDFADHTIASAPDLSLTLRGIPEDPATVTPGDPIRYVLTIANSLAGTETATGLVVTSPTPVNTTYVTDSALDEAGATITGGSNPFATGYALPDLAPGGSVSVQFDAQVDLPLPDGTSIEGSGSLDADQLGAPLLDATTVTVDSAIALSVDLRSTPTEGGTVTPGDTVAYRAAITNDSTATATATGVTVEIPTPAGTTYVPGSALDTAGTPIAGGSNPFDAAFALPDLVPGQTVTVEFDVQVDSPQPNGTTLDAVATADAAQAASPVNDPAPLTVTSSPDLTLSAIASPPVAATITPGSTITYTIRVTNQATGTETATGLTVTGPTPTDTSYVAGSARDELGGAIGGAVNPFAAGYALPDLAPGAFWEISYQVAVDAPLPDGTVITDVVTADADQLGTPLTEPVSHTVSSVVVLSADLTAAPAEGGTVTPGDTVRYLLTITNDAAATVTATGITALLPVPVDTTYVPSSATDENGDPIPGATNPFATPYALPDLPPGAAWSIGIDVVVDTPLPDGTGISTTATVDADQAPSTLTDAAAHTVTSAPALSVITQSSPAEGSSVTPGDTVTYEVTVTNGVAATETATGLVVTLPTAADTTFVAGSAIDENGDPLANATNPFATGWTLPDLAPGDSWTLSIQAIVDSPLPNGTVVSTTGSADADQLATPLTDPAALTVSSATATFALLEPTPVTTQTVRPTQTITYGFTVGNDPSATETATGVSLTLPTPAGTTYVPGSALDENGDPIGGSVNPFAGAYAIADLAPGDSATVFITVTVDLGVLEGSTIDQTASLDIDQLGSPKQDGSSHTVQVYVNSPFHDQIVVSEVRYQQAGPLLADNDEAVELRNLTPSPIDVSGWTLADADKLGTQTDTTGSFATDLPPGTVVPAFGHLVVWLGVDQTSTKPGFTNLVGSLTPEVWVGGLPALDAAGDDIWLYDADLAVVDRIAWGAGSELAPAPPAGIAPWDAVAQAGLASAPAEKSIASTPSTSPTTSSACYEHTGTGTAGDPVLCPAPPTTVVTDVWPGRVTSLGDANTIESPLRGAAVISEVLYRESGGGLLGNDEAIEIHNTGANPLDLTGWTLADGDVRVGYSDPDAFAHVFPSGSVLPPGGIAVVWIGVDQTVSLPGFTDVGADLEQHLGLAAVLQEPDEDLWLFDPSLLLVDYMGWGNVAGNRSTPPSDGFWDTANDGDIRNALAGQSIAVTPFGTDADSARCWERTTSGGAASDPVNCPTTPPTLDTDTYLLRVTSLGDPNT